MNEEDEAFEDLAKRQGDWGMQGSRKHQILRYAENVKPKENMNKPITSKKFALDLWGVIQMAIEEAVLAEREACAKLVEPTEEHRKEAQHYIGGEEGVELLDNLAAAIRARGQA
jgi:hypothetical protein